MCRDSGGQSQDKLGEDKSLVTLTSNGFSKFGYSVLKGLPARDRFLLHFDNCIIGNTVFSKI